MVTQSAQLSASITSFSWFVSTCVSMFLRVVLKYCCAQLLHMRPMMTCKVCECYLVLLSYSPTSTDWIHTTKFGLL